MKAYTKGAKRRGKKYSKRKDMYPQFEREEAAAPITVEEDPLKTALRARGNAVGEKPYPELRDAMLGDEAGKALWVAIGSTDERRELYNVFAEYDRALSLYHSRVLGRQRFPAVSKMEFMPERLQASASDHVDLRTTEEKAEASRKRMAEMEEALDKLHTWNKAIIRSVAFHQETLVNQGKLTGAGRNFVAAVKQLKGVLG